MKHSFLSGNPALDFAATLRSRRGAPFEMLTSAESLDSWFLESGIVNESTRCKPADVRQAVSVREAIYSLVLARMGGEEYSSEALSTVNDAARTPPAVPQLRPGGRHIEATSSQALSTVVRHAIEVLSGADAPLLKECADPECRRVFIDSSRGGRREWCSMEPCGNRMKAAAYRARKRKERQVSL
ncbi:ABATE domain-containing protein [Arthrobacter sp. ZGTC131]|uniref:CGNR zinc finger domain-containing protein n=1 Tax=Arthrobacter sp. ZGTC131 TaxID=2058898 RepID=UPI001CA54DC9|nr:CGNR zinc finger domain-containing protein [Arthrobacter sp. ZGTC131]